MITIYIVGAVSGELEQKESKLSSSFQVENGSGQDKSTVAKKTVKTQTKRAIMSSPVPDQGKTA